MFGDELDQQVRSQALHRHFHSPHQAQAFPEAGRFRGTAILYMARTFAPVDSSGQVRARFLPGYKNVTWLHVPPRTPAFPRFKAFSLFITLSETHV